MQYHQAAQGHPFPFDDLENDNNGSAFRGRRNSRCESVNRSGSVVRGLDDKCAYTMCLLKCMNVDEATITAKFLLAVPKKQVPVFMHRMSEDGSQITLSSFQTSTNPQIHIVVKDKRTEEKDKRTTEAYLIITFNKMKIRIDVPPKLGLQVDITKFEGKVIHDLPKTDIKKEISTLLRAINLDAMSEEAITALYTALTAAVATTNTRVTVEEVHNQ